MAKKSSKLAAARALKNHKFAQKILSGEEDYPEVRDAILGDLFNSTRDLEAAGTKHAAGALKYETRFIDAGPRFSPMGPCYVKYYPKMPAPDAWEQWAEMPRLNLQRLAGKTSD